MFHAARALIYSKGYREKSHYYLVVALQALFVDKGLIEEELAKDFHTAHHPLSFKPLDHPADRRTMNSQMVPYFLDIFQDS